MVDALAGAFKFGVRRAQKRRLQREGELRISNPLRNQQPYHRREHRDRLIEQHIRATGVATCVFRAHVRSISGRKCYLWSEA